MTHRKKIILMGGSGSIGEQVFQVVAAHKERFHIYGVAIKNNIKKLLHLLQSLDDESLPAYVAVFDKTEETKDIKEYFDSRKKTINILTGEAALLDLVSLPEGDMVIAAIVGAQGLPSTLKAAQQGKDLALANKEALIMGGSLLLEEVKKNKGRLLPIDSEHGALFRLLHAHGAENIQNLWLPASGGAFRDFELKQLSHVTAESALQHPTWTMGPKITIDSATLVNKGLEVIEAHLLFDVAYEQISVVIHRESLVHALVEYKDGFIYNEISPTSMTYPIASALFWPDAVPYNENRLDIMQLGRLHFEPVDDEKFPALKLCYQAGQKGGNAPIVLNAANEIAVEAFLQGRIRFLEIARIIEDVLQRVPVRAIYELADILEQDQWARQLAWNIIE